MQHLLEKNFLIINKCYQKVKEMKSKKLLIILILQVQEQLKQQI